MRHPVRPTLQRAPKNRMRFTGPLRVTVVLCALAAGSGCPGDATPTAQELCESGSVPDGESAGRLEAQVGDEAFEACVAGSVRSGDVGDPLASLTILGERFVENERYGFLLRITGPAVGVAAVGSSQTPTASGQFEGEDNVRFLADATHGSGQIELTALSEDEATGTFSFSLDAEVGDDTLEVVTGTFTVPVSVQ